VKLTTSEAAVGTLKVAMGASLWLSASPHVTPRAISTACTDESETLTPASPAVTIAETVGSAAPPVVTVTAAASRATATPTCFMRSSVRRSVEAARVAVKPSPRRPLLRRVSPSEREHLLEDLERVSQRRCGNRAEAPHEALSI